MTRAVIVSFLALTCCQTASSTITPSPLSDAELFQKAKTAIVATLKDPDSAKFSDLHRVNYNGLMGPGEYICGKVNAKNIFGGYTGPQIIAYSVQSGNVLPSDGDSLIAAAALSVCVSGL